MVSWQPLLTRLMADNALPKPPNFLIDLSLQLGIDLTPNQDLEERLDAAVRIATGCRQDLARLVTVVRGYEVSVTDHKPVDLTELENLIKEAMNEQADTRGEETIGDGPDGSAASERDGGTN